MQEIVSILIITRKYWLNIYDRLLSKVLGEA